MISVVSDRAASGSGIAEELLTKEDLLEEVSETNVGIHIDNALIIAAIAYTVFAAMQTGISLMLLVGLAFVLSMSKSDNTEKIKGLKKTLLLFNLASKKQCKLQGGQPVFWVFRKPARLVASS